MKKTILILATLLLAAVSCDKHTQRGREEIKDVELSTPSGWTVRYVGRENYTESDGYVSRVEHFSVACPKVGYYFLRRISPEDLKELYGNDPRAARKAFFEEEAKYLREDAFYYGESVTDYLYTDEYLDWYPDRFPMGSWLVFLIELDRNGNITGSYVETSVNLAEETASEAYNQWIGEWSIGRDKVYYPVSIEKGEANFTYIVRGWETGDSIDANTGEQMNQEYIEAEFDYNSGNLYFVSQYLGNYTENNLNIYEYFLGQIDYQGGTAAENGLWIITDTGRDLAATVRDENGTVRVLGCDITANINGKDVPVVFAFMQYIAEIEYGQNNYEYSTYNKNVPGLPLTMTKTRASVDRPAWKPRTVTRASVHYSQPNGRRGDPARSCHAVKAAQ